MRTFIIIAATAALSFSILASAHADTIDDPPSVSVRFADLDLDHAAGSATLYKRLSVAARAVCRELDPRDSANSDLKPGRQQQYQSCVDKAIIGAVAKINRAAFTSYVSTKMTLPATLTNVQIAAK
jgi:UrcA family protein